MAKVTIYVPDGLKARMDAVGELNWSAVAQRAFEVEVNLKEIMMQEADQVVARLRASKEQECEAERTAGRSAGQRWAREWAEYGELERVATYEGDIEDAETLACLIFDEDAPHGLHWPDVQELWERLRGRRSDPPSTWIAGFVEGAGEVWDEVANKI